MPFHKLREKMKQAEPASEALPPEDDRQAREALEKIRVFYDSLKKEMGKVIVGQEEVLDMVIISMICRGHVLLEGVPGLGKTLMFKTMAKLMHLSFSHVQFTPDLMPSDITGTEVIQNDPETGNRSMQFLKGPVFCNFLLADEINRTSPKTQSALLQAMQDYEVAVGNEIYTLPQPFFVLATQNPMDQEGVYPLPEAQLDRFMFNVFIEYPGHDEELEIARRYTRGHSPEISAVIEKEDLMRLQTMVREMLISESVLQYAVSLVRATRPSEGHAMPFVGEWISCGAGPRATLNLILAAKARALLKGRFCATTEDVRATSDSVLRHRIKISFAAQAEGISASEVVRKIMEKLPGPEGKS